MDSQGRGLERKGGVSGGVFKAARGAGWGGGGLQSSKVWIAFGETPAEKDWPANLRGSAMVGMWILEDEGESLGTWERD